MLALRDFKGSKFQVKFERRGTWNLKLEFYCDLTFDLTDQPGKDAYPITGVVYAVCYQKQPRADRQAVVDFLHWATHEGQSYARPMNYAPLPTEIVEKVEEKLKSIR